MQGKTCKLWLSHITLPTVVRLLKQLKNSKSTSIDQLDNYSVKVSAEIIAKPLHHIITLSIMQCKFPTSWKLSKVIPLHKKLSRLDMKNYRPVAILSPLSKILEKIVFNQMYAYLSKNKIFHENLHGYRHNRSTNTALLTMYDRWTKAASSGKVSGVVLIDLSAAFDLVDHRILCQKLEIYGLQEDFVSWIKSYLSDRYQAVWIDSKLSEFLHCDTGVPQGSNLGPLFFLIFFNDLPDSVSSAVDAYADDTTITTSANSINAIEDQLNVDCEKVDKWMKSNKLKMNADKTHLLTVGTQRRLNSMPRHLEVSIDGVLVKEEPSGCESLLGCKVQADLKWDTHVSNLKTNLSRRLAGLRCIISLCPKSVRKLLAEGIFNSVLVYCLPLYGGLSKHHVQDIQVLQNKAARMVCNAAVWSRRSTMFENLGWLTFNQLISYHSLILVHKIRRNEDPEHLARNLCRDGRNGRILSQNPVLSLTRNSFCYRASSEWNRLPASLRHEAKLGAFKHGLRKWILNNVQQFLDEA